MKRCCTCRETKPLAAFYADPRYRDGHGSRCKDCTKTAAIKSHRDNPERTKANTKRWREKMKDQLPEYQRRRKFGIPFGTYDRMLAEQGGACAICRAEFPRLLIDHCHASGKVRGLLCNNCNTGIGMFSDDPQLMQAAAQYVRQHLVG